MVKFFLGLNIAKEIIFYFLGYGANIQITSYAMEEVVIPEVEVVTLEPPPPPPPAPVETITYHHIIYITSKPTLEQINIFINVLLELTLKYKILDEPSIADLLTTFRKCIIFLKQNYI